MNNATAVSVGWGGPDEAPWITGGLCRKHPEVDFTPARVEEARAALDLCQRCGVQPECLEHALRLGKEADGVWGGLTARQRRKLCRDRAAEGGRPDPAPYARSSRLRVRQDGGRGTVAELIGQGREAGRVTQKELAQLVGVDTRTIGYWESGRSRPSDPVLIRLSRVLDVPLDAWPPNNPHGTCGAVKANGNTCRRSIDAGGACPDHA